MGQCNGCGECCKGLVFILPGLKTNRIHKNYYKKHGCTIRGDTLFVLSPCKHLDENNKCKIYEDRPILCKAFKGQSDSNTSAYFIPEGCGYND